MELKPTKGEYLGSLLRSRKTIFSTQDAALLWREADVQIVNRRLAKYAAAGKLVRVHRGLYAKDNGYDRFELATRIYTPAYVGFETVLTRAGVCFQHYGNIFAATYVKRDVVADGQKISFVRLPDFVLANTDGIEHLDNMALATKERAFLDRLYVSKDYHFDNLAALDWPKVFELLPVYQSQRLAKKVQEFYRDHRNNQSEL